MNIAIFASAFHPSLGGVEELCRQLAHEYRRRKFKVCIVTNRWPRSLPEFESFEGISVYRVAMRAPGAGFKSEITYRLTSHLVQRQVARILRQQQIDLIHVQCVGCNAYYASRAARQIGLPLVVSLQGELSMDATRLFERSAFARATLRNSLHEATCVTACSEQTLAEAEHFLGNSLSGKSTVIHNGIRFADFTEVQPFKHPRPYILAIGRHVPQKGFDVLIRAMALLCTDSRWNGDLLIAGDGPEREHLESLARECGIGARIVFTGRADRAVAGSLFAGCAVFVLPSRHEPFGIVNLEAMACGKPVIATQVGGVPEIVRHGETGWLVPPQDPESLAKGIKTLWHDANLQQRLSTNGLRTAEQHDWSYLADQYINAYAAACPATRMADHRAITNLRGETTPSRDHSAALIGKEAEPI